LTCFYRIFPRVFSPLSSPRSPPALPAIFFPSLSFDVSLFPLLPFPFTSRPFFLRRIADVFRTCCGRPVFVRSLSFLGLFPLAVLARLLTARLSRSFFPPSAPQVILLIRTSPRLFSPYGVATLFPLSGLRLRAESRPSSGHTLWNSSGNSRGTRLSLPKSGSFGRSFRQLCIPLRGSFPHS